MKRSWIICVGAAAMTVTLICGSFECLAVADDWPMLGRDGTRNGVSEEIGAPVEWNVESREGDRVIRESRGIRWSAPLGSETHSSPVVSGGLVWIGTNSRGPGAELGEEVHSVLKCFRVADGKQVYEYDSPKLGSRVHDPGWTGLGSSPLIEGDRLWLTTNRSEVLCLDIGPLILGEGAPRELWKLDLIKTFDISPYVPLMGPPRPCSIGPSWNDRIFVTTNNGVGADYTTVPKPAAPNLVCLNKETGEVYWKDNSPGFNVLLTQFASPTVTAIRGQMQVIVPQSDGWVRAFDPMTGEKLWEFDVNAKESVYTLAGRSGRNLLLGNAVVYEDRVYMASGRDAEQSGGVGRLVCIDPTKRGDVSSELAVDAAGQPLPRRRVQAVNPQAGEKAIPNPNSALIWDFVSCGQAFEDQMHRTMSSVVIAKGLIIVSDVEGLVHCFDAKTGQRHWRYDMFAETWASPLIVDDKIYIAGEDGEVAIFGRSADPDAALPKKNGVPEPLHQISMVEPIHSSPVFANGVLYLATRKKLFAIAADKDEPDPEQTGGFWPQWRGPNRDNVSPDKGLLKEWPVAGPPLVWRLKGLGDGVAPVSIGGGRMFSTSLYESTEYVRALNEETGAHLWSVVLGPTLPQHPLMRWLTQRSPTLDGERLYAMSLLGELVCLQSQDGRELWRTNYLTDFAGQRGQVGYSDCPLLDGERLICRPGGPDASIVALDKRTGAVLWKCAVADAGPATYSNGALTTIAGQRQFVVLLEKALVGVSVDDGKLLWRHNWPAEQHYDPAAHTPFVRDGLITCLDGSRRGITLLEVTRADDMLAVKEVYAKASGHIARFQDDTVFLEDHFYELSAGVFSCYDGRTGGAIWQNRMGIAAAAPKAAPGSGRGSSNAVAVTYADSNFYFHGDDGLMQLVEANFSEPVIKCEFALPDHQSSMGATRPIVTGGRLYVREDDQLFCFEVRETAPARKSEPRTIQLEMPTPATGSGEKSGEPKARTLRSVFVPTPQDIVEKMLELASVKKTDVIYDLGSGDGRIVITAAGKYGCRAIGYELDKELVESSRTNAEAAGVKSLVTFERKDLFTADLRDADVIAVFLLPQQLEKLVPQLEKMKPGSRVVSHQFEIRGFPADQVLKTESSEEGAQHTLHLWTLPLKKGNK